MSARDKPRLPAHEIAGGDQHSRRAVAALQGVLLRERLTQARHEGIVVEPLDGAYVGTVAGDRVGDARARDLAVDLHGAGAADAMLAPHVRAGEQHVLAQEVGKVRARRHLRFGRLAVDGKCDPHAA